LGFLLLVLVLCLCVCVCFVHGFVRLWLYCVFLQCVGRLCLALVIRTLGALLKLHIYNSILLNENMLFTS
jgi:hypothetical protein